MRALQKNLLTYDDKGLIPAIIQDSDSGKVLMLGYMNEDSLDKTLEYQRVTFYSRSKGRLWTKGEESGHYLQLVNISQDCDGDTLLIKAIPHGPACHTGTDTCWKETNTSDPLLFLRQLANVIKSRYENPNDASYTASLFENGINRVAQKVGEEAVELIIEAKDDNDDLFIGEAADLIYHLLVLLQAKKIDISEVIEVLQSRH